MRLSLIVPLGCFTVLAACGGREQVKSSYIGTASMDQDQVTQLLTQQNFKDISGLHKNGRNWVGQADKDGHSVNLDISPDGTIHTK